VVLTCCALFAWQACIANQRGGRKHTAKKDEVCIYVMQYILSTAYNLFVNTSISISRTSIHELSPLYLPSMHCKQAKPGQAHGLGKRSIYMYDSIYLIYNIQSTYAQQHVYICNFDARPSSLYPYLYTFANPQAEAGGNNNNGKDYGAYRNAG